MHLNYSDPPKKFIPQKPFISNLEGKFPFTSKGSLMINIFLATKQGKMLFHPIIIINMLIMREPFDVNVNLPTKLLINGF